GGGGFVVSDLSAPAAATLSQETTQAYITAVEQTTKLTLTGTPVDGVTWQVSLDGTDFSYQATDGDATRADIAEQLALKISAAGSPFSATAVGGEITVSRAEGTSGAFAVAPSVDAVLHLSSASSFTAAVISGSMNLNGTEDFSRDYQASGSIEIGGT